MGHDLGAKREPTPSDCPLTSIMYTVTCTHRHTHTQRHAFTKAHTINQLINQTCKIPLAEVSEVLFAIFVLFF